MNQDYSKENYKPDSIDKRDKYEEAAARYEFDFGLPRKEAERLAWQDVYVNPN